MGLILELVGIKVFSFVCDLVGFIFIFFIVIIWVIFFINWVFVCEELYNYKGICFID